MTLPARSVVTIASAAWSTAAARRSRSAAARLAFWRAVTASRATTRAISNPVAGTCWRSMSRSFQSRTAGATKATATATYGSHGNDRE